MFGCNPAAQFGQFGDCVRSLMQHELLQIAPSWRRPPSGAWPHGTGWSMPGSRGAPADRSERAPAHGLADPPLHFHGVRLHLWHDRAARLRDLILIAALTASVISFFSIPFSGYLSDRIGQGACAIAARSLTITLLLSSWAGARRSSPRPCSPNTNGAMRSDLQLDHHPVRGAAKRLYE